MKNFRYGNPSISHLCANVLKKLEALKKSDLLRLGWRSSFGSLFVRGSVIQTIRNPCPRWSEVSELRNEDHTLTLTFKRSLEIEGEFRSPAIFPAKVRRLPNEPEILN